MTDAPATPTRRRGPWRGGAFRVWAILGVAVLVIVAAVAGLGGFNDVPVEKLPKISLGDVEHGTQVDTTITAVYVTPRAPGQSYEAEEGKQYLVVTATLLNTTNKPSTLTSELVRVLIDGVVSANDDASFVDPRTGNQVGFLQPGIPLEGAFSWLIDDTVENGDDVIVGIFDHFPTDDPRYSDGAFTPPEPIARILTTIGERA